MASLHHETPPAPLELGWFVLCLPTGDVKASIAFYERLGLRLTGGQPEHGWAMMTGGNAELNPMQGLEALLLNFRGADTPVLAETFRSRDLEVTGQNLYDPEKWPATLHTDAHGNTLPAQGSGDFTVTDPDGRGVYFDTVPIERAWHRDGQRGSTPEMTGQWPDETANPGRFTCALRTAQLARAAEFYERLGLSLLEQRPDCVRLGYQSRPERCTISLYSDLPVSAAVLFRGADASVIQQLAGEPGAERKPGPDSGEALWLTDPGGNVVILSEAMG